MADYGAGFITEGARLGLARDQLEQSRFLQLAQMAQQQNQFNSELDYKKTAPKKLPMNEQQLQDMMAIQAGSKDPAILARVRAYSALDAGKTTLGTDESGRPVFQPKQSPWDIIGNTPRQSTFSALQDISPQAATPGPLSPAQWDQMAITGKPVMEPVDLAQLEPQGSDFQNVMRERGMLPQLPGLDPYYETGPSTLQHKSEKNIDMTADILKEREKASLGVAGHEQKGQADIKLKRKEAQPAEELALKSAIQEAVDVNKTIADLYDNANMFTAGFVGEKTKGIPGSPANDFNQNLKTLEADAGLSKLIEVKERGGTFGALQEKELDLLVASRAAIAQSQSVGQFKENLIKYQTVRNRVLPLLAEAFKQKHGYVPDGLFDDIDKNIITPDAQKARDGQTATNPATGERIKLVNGKWVPL